jgi:hypothetical protein
MQHLIEHCTTSGPRVELRERMTAKAGSTSGRLLG